MFHRCTRALPCLAITALVLVGSRSLGAQATQLMACFVPQSGTMYSVGQNGAPAACRAAGHVLLQWNTVGPSGPQGPAGVAGPAGPSTVVPGPTGPQGLKGDAGPKGDLGPAGSAGPAGSTGPQGVGGTQGLAGPVGPTATLAGSGTLAQFEQVVVPVYVIVTAGVQHYLTASCPVGKVAIAGGMLRGAHVNGTGIVAGRPYVYEVGSYPNGAFGFSSRDWITHISVDSTYTISTLIAQLVVVCAKVN